MGIVLNIAVLVFALIMAAIPLRYDIIKRDQAGDFLRFTKAALYFFIALLLSLGFGVWKIVFDDKTSNRNEATISSIESSLKKQKAWNTELQRVRDNLQTWNNDLTDEIASLKNLNNQNTDKIIHQRPKVDYRANLDLCSPYADMGDNPHFVKGDTTIDFNICNVGNDQAENLSTYCVLLEHVGGRRLFVKKQSNKPNRALSIVQGTPGDTLEYVIKKISGSYFIYLKVSYTNSRGVSPDSLQRIFFVDNSKIRESNDSEYVTVKAAMQDKHLW
jgi:hypothetical protein